jgi:hypothetical protein
MVRNHAGKDEPVALFTAHIEHARGLGNERYLTNPLSSTDSELLEAYLSKERSNRLSFGADWKLRGGNGT